MNAPIPQKIYDYLKHAGYEVRPELGDSVINHGDSHHVIYIQIRDGKKTYIPITITTPLETSPEQDSSSSETVSDALSFTEAFRDTFTTNDEQLGADSAVPDEISVAPVESMNTPLNYTTSEAGQASESVSPHAELWDENVSELLAQARRTADRLRKLVN